MTPTLCSLVLSLLTLASASFAAETDSGLDPKHDPKNLLKYIPSNRLTAMAVFAVLQVAILQAWFIRKWGAKWMMSMTIGAFSFALGLSLRFKLHSNPDSKGIYIMENSLVVLSPCLFIAADYVLLGRLSAYLKADKYLLISSRKISIVFVMSDVFTFLIQSMGGGMLAATSDPDKVALGSHIFLAGLIAQLVSFFFFSLIYAIFLRRIRNQSPDIWHKDSTKKWYNDWRALAGALILSSIGIIIRSLFRVVELAQGFDGYLATSETCFYSLDTVPLLIAIGIYVPFWPGRIMAEEKAYSLRTPLIEMESQGPSYYKTPGSV